MIKINNIFILFGYLILNTCAKSTLSMPISNVNVNINKQQTSAISNQDDKTSSTSTSMREYNLSIDADDCLVVEQTVEKLGELLEHAFKSDKSSLKFFIRNFNTTCLINIELNKSHNFNLNYVILLKLLKYISTHYATIDQMTNLNFQCNHQQQHSIRLNLNVKVLIESMYTSLATKEDLSKCVLDDSTGDLEISESQPIDEQPVLADDEDIEPQKSPIKSRDDSYIRLKYNNNNNNNNKRDDSSKKNYFVYLLICMFLIVFLLFVAIFLFYKLNRAYANKRSGHGNQKRRKLPKTATSSGVSGMNPVNNLNPFEFFNLFNKPNKSEYDYYFGLGDSSETDKNNNNTSETLTTTVNNTSTNTEKKVKNNLR